MATNETLLKEIREDFKRFHSYWQPIFAEGDTDMRFISGDPWNRRNGRSGTRNDYV